MSAIAALLLAGWLAFGVRLSRRRQAFHRPRAELLLIGNCLRCGKIWDPETCGSPDRFTHRPDRPPPTRVPGGGVPRSG